jgi:endonuclease/exonuclease/phosphatase family metal-dependent hydrolase
VRVVTYNIRNLVALDWASFWLRRRRRLGGVVSSLEADLIGMQEAYPSQIRWLANNTLRNDEWEVAGLGRKPGGAGEGVPLWHRPETLRLLSDRTRWFGPTPEIPGSGFAGAQFPRIATIAHYSIADESRVAVANLHLDSLSADFRGQSIEQVVEWLTLGVGSTPTIVLGDFNAPMTEAGFSILREVGMQTALPGDTGPTSNGFGRDLEGQQQIDHVFVSSHFQVDHAEIHTAAGYASDHFPVVVDLTLTPP